MKNFDKKEAMQCFKKVVHSDPMIIFILGWAIFSKGVSYLPLGDEQQFRHPFESNISEDFLVIFWVVVGANAMISAFVQRSVYQAISFAACIGTLVLWGFGFIVSKDFFFMQTGSIYMGFALVAVIAINRGRRHQITIKKSEE